MNAFSWMDTPVLPSSGSGVRRCTPGGKGADTERVQVQAAGSTQLRPWLLGTSVNSFMGVKTKLHKREH